MQGLRIYLADGNYDGPVIVSSDSSKISAIRVAKENMDAYEKELNGLGIYLLLFEEDSVYVGQTGLSLLKRQLVRKHSKKIDEKWHTVFAFKIAADVSEDELLFIKNAIAEYAHHNFKKCLAGSLTKQKCNFEYRCGHYNLNDSQIEICNQYVRDIEFYLNFIPKTIFPSKFNSLKSNKVESDGRVTKLFRCVDGKRKAPAQARITFYPGQDKDITTVVRAGSTIRRFQGMGIGDIEKKVAQEREKYIQAGKIDGSILLTDIAFSTPSFAASFILGKASTGLDNWMSMNKGDKGMLLRSYIKGEATSPKKQEYSFGDIVEMNFTHSCGGNSWKVIRVADDEIMIFCTTCKESIMLSNEDAAERIIRILDSKAAISEQAKSVAKKEKPSKVKAEPPKPINKQFKIDDCLTRNNLSSCRKKNHNLTEVVGSVQKILEYRRIVDVNFPAVYCQNCKCTYITEQEYERLTRVGFLLCKVVEKDNWTTSRKKGTALYSNWNTESKLHSLGYSVAETTGLKRSQRESLLETLVIHNIMSKQEILEHLSWLISQKQNQKRMRRACQKWQDDYEFVRGLAPATKKVEIKSIYHTNYRRK